jgi:undecaprenyl-diphosphatase
VPGALAGLLLDKWAESAFRAPALVAGTMILMGLVLWAADRGALKARAMSWRDGTLVGLAQALAIVPGVSRSGATISAALFLGYEREEAARFSFLLALPITAGAALVKVPTLLRDTADRGPLVVGMASAAVFGFLAIRLLLGYVRTRNYRPFVYYRLLFGLFVLAVVLARRGLLG